jgi:hypothetical protein
VVVGRGESREGREYSQAQSFEPGEIVQARRSRFEPGEFWWTGVWLNESNDGRYRDCVAAFEIKRRPEQNNPFQRGKNTNNFNGPFVPDNAAFVGWAGREGSYVDALQMIWVKFDKAQWDEVRFPDEN